MSSVKYYLTSGTTTRKQKDNNYKNKYIIDKWKK